MPSDTSQKPHSNTRKHVQPHLYRIKRSLRRNQRRLLQHGLKHLSIISRRERPNQKQKYHQLKRQQPPNSRCIRPNKNQHLRNLVHLLIWHNPRHLQI
jgi:hypothetical protein